MVVKRKSDSVGSRTSKFFKKAKNKVDHPKVHPLGTTLSDLPYDIVNNILLKLPIESVLICKCVCKSWRSIMLDPHLVQLYVEHAPISASALVRTSDSRRVSRILHLLNFDEFRSNEAQNLPSDNDCSHVCSCKDFPRPNCDNHMKLHIKFKIPLRDSKMVLDTMLEARRKGKKRTIIACKPKDDRYDVVNSCNGLLCLWDPLCDHGFVPFNPKTLVVCNPITGEFIRLPQSKNDSMMRWRCVYPGFGYLKKTNEYKVVRIYLHKSFREDGVVEIHTLGTRLWRNIKYHDGPCWLELKFPTCLNGKLHFLVYNLKEASILCFDLESETSNSLPCPWAISSTFIITKRRISFGELKGSLYLCCPFGNENHLRFWTMEKYGDGQSWTTVFTFDIEHFRFGPHLHQPRVLFGGSGILIYGPSRFFVFYDPQKRLFKFLEGRGTSLELEPIFHIPSFIRLKDVVKGDNIEVLNVHSRCAAFKLREDKEVFYLAKYKADKRI